MITDSTNIYKTIIIPVLLILCLLAYCNSLGNNFVYDDRYFIVDNPWIRSFSNFKLFFTDPENTVASRPWPGIYRPLRTLSYTLDYKLFGQKPFGFHLTNLLLHLLNVFLFYRIMMHFFNNYKISFLGSLIFGIHPVQTESVSWISSRAELLYAFFSLVTMFFIIHGVKKQTVKKHWLLFAGAGYLLALISKETAIIIPFLVFIILFYFYEPQNEIKNFFKSNFIIFLVFFLFMAVYLKFRFSLFETISQQSNWGGSFLHTIYTSLKVFVLYLKLIILPISLTVDHRPAVVTGVADPWFISGLILFSAAVYFCLSG